MMTQNSDKKRGQIVMFCMDDMVPKDHLLRKIDKAIDWNSIYDLVAEKYSPDQGRPSMDPVMLIKVPFIQYLYGIRSMRQTIREIEVNVAYRWFLGLDMLDTVPHFTTFGKNYTRRFKDTDLLEQHFEKHGKEMGFETKEAYEKADSDVINNPKALFKTEAEDGDYVYYVEETNEFVVLSLDGYIRTYFLPSSGKKYFDRQ